ncbi:styrene monooxygenase/indole monooxygenase family protein [Nocardia sp. NBC_01327]|uniref:styrene monooxygenase/indole monooxygenase family protein n=1 Tax=Nocardia sp. NBC_01327 TaxID=2903593 RepID=UPI002E0F7856|nr:FAD-binding oxidoreductase [Nocardia sp. NBC_01327]
MKQVGDVRGKVTIVGAGQAGLALGIGLIRFGFDVTIVSDRTADEIRDGRVTSSQCMFDLAQGFERALGINFWDDECPLIEGLRISAFLPQFPENPANTWSAALGGPARSVDQRLKMPRWMEEFERIGGTLKIESATVDSLEEYAETSDLVVVAAGKGAIAGLFETDTARSPYREPQRSIAMFYVDGLAKPSGRSMVEFSIIPEIGEYLTYPALTAQGPCDIMLFESIPGRAWDVWSPTDSNDELLSRAKGLLAEYLPRELRRAQEIALIDDNAALIGRLTPTVRKPVATLPSGAAVLGMADVVVLNDPITAQGSNNASKCADIYLQKIIRHSGDYNRAFMSDAFGEYWKTAGPATAFTNQFLSSPSPRHARDLQMAAAQYPEIATRFAHCMNDPRDTVDWILDRDGAYRYTSEVANRYMNFPMAS